jgi:hypothetical protein
MVKKGIFPNYSQIFKNFLHKIFVLEIIYILKAATFLKTI